MSDTYGDTNFKTEGEIKDLKQDWLDDPCWDIEDTKGFEAHRQELYIYRLEHELKYERSHSRRLQDALNRIRLALGEM
jgi:hypothetical protein